MKKFKLACFALISSFTAATAEDTLTIYSQRHYPADQKLFTDFTEQTGVKINVVKGSADELIERLKSEGEASPADLLLTKDAARIHWATEEGLLQGVESEALKNQVPAYLRDPKGRWVGVTQRARVIVYSKERVKKDEISSYADLAKPDWKGRVLARSSSNIYNQSLLASLISNVGKKDALLWAVQVRKNMARPPQGSDRDQIRAVAAGLGDVAIVNTYYLGLLAKSDNPADQEVASKVAICFPEQGENGRGTHMNISAAGVTKYSKNKEHAVKFLEFITGKGAQAFYPHETYEYPLSLDLTTPMHKSWGSFKPDSLHLSELGKYNADAIKLFQTAQWE